MVTSRISSSKLSVVTRSLYISISKSTAFSFASLMFLSFTDAISPILVKFTSTTSSPAFSKSVTTDKIFFLGVKTITPLV